jgi:hypothetical protein
MLLEYLISIQEFRFTLVLVFAETLISSCRKDCIYVEVMTYELSVLDAVLLVIRNRVNFLIVVITRYRLHL